MSGNEYAQARDVEHGDRVGLATRPITHPEPLNMLVRSDSSQRPLAFEQKNFMWNMRRVPAYLVDGVTPHPARSSAIFVVHGMGQQHWTETAAHLRAGFEVAVERIAAWQEEHRGQSSRSRELSLPPPFIWEGFWADYDNIEKTFPDDWKCFVDRERTFFSNLWRQRVVSGPRTIAWMIHQQLRLLHPRVLREVGPFAWILYWPLQIVSTAALLFAWFRFPKAITEYCNDVRLYLEPQGVVERAIVQHIDESVERCFMQLIGLDCEFRRLHPDHPGEWIEAGGRLVTFDRVVWIAHSLGTVISYNVLSSLFHKADELAKTGDSEQQNGVDRFRNALSRFVTMGSPLDKVAFLFKDKSLRPWPNVPHRALLNGGEYLTSSDPTKTEWWINFYHVLDPVSGSLESRFICGDQPPSNIHIKSGFIPGLAHVAYWKDLSTLRFILGRTYGTAFLRDKEYRPWPPRVLSALAAGAYVVWAVILLGIVYVLYSYAPVLLRAMGKAVLKWITG